MSPTPRDGGGPGDGDPSAGRSRGEPGRPAPRHQRPRGARLLAFVPLALVVSALVLLLGLPWWALLLGVAALAYVLLFHA